MNLFLKMGPVVCQLQDFFPEYIWNTWQWKIDPYVIKNDTNQNASLHIIKNEKRKIDESEIEGLLSEEKDGFYSRQVWRLQSGELMYRLIQKKHGNVLLSYVIDKEWMRITLLEDNTASGGQASFEFLSRMVLYSMIKQSVLTFHGVLMEYQGKGIIISAPSETGKTTHARLWRDYKNALIINGDNACCVKEKGQWMGFGIPWSGTSGESVNRSVPIQALVILNRGEKNQAKKLSLYEAFGESLPMLHTPTWDADTSELALTMFDDFLENIPVIHLDCCPDEDAVNVLYQYLETMK